MALAIISFVEQILYVSNLLIGQKLRASTSGPTTFRNAVLNIVSLCADKQMIWIAARRVIANGDKRTYPLELAHDALPMRYGGS
jgi:hypothetical protein